MSVQGVKRAVDEEAGPVDDDECGRAMVVEEEKEEEEEEGLMS